MAYTVNDGCISCDSCQPECPTGAIKPKAEEDGYWIDPTLCDDCKDFDVPQCTTVCDVGSLVPLPPRKGRCQSSLLPETILDLFLNGKTTPFASSMAIWETCNVLSQRQSLPWQTDADGKLYYHRPVHRGRGEMTLRLDTDPETDSPTPMATEEATAAIANFDIRAACVHLIFAAYAVTLDRPWEETFTLTDRHIEQYLGLDKRKDLTKLEKLTLVKELVYQSCRVLAAIDWPRQGKVQSFTLPEHRIWHLLDTQYYFEEDRQGCQHLIGLSFTVRSGIWSQYFLNKGEYRNHTAFYQYGSLPQSLLAEIMTNWQQHEGAVRLLLWLLFKLRLGGDPRITVRTILKIAYGEERLTEATTVRGTHKRLLKTFESDLETLYYYGLKPSFDPETYPADIQPMWVKVAEIPDDPDDALAFWTDDTNGNLSLTEAAPRDKWQRLLNARLLGFDLPEEWQQSIPQRTKKRRRRQSKSRSSEQVQNISGRDIKAARQRQNLTQRALADRLGKSQSWIRDIEKGRFKVNSDHRNLLQEVLDIK